MSTKVTRRRLLAMSAGASALGLSGCFGSVDPCAKDDLPILSALASNYTTFANYFCSMIGPTWENHLYQLTGTTQVDMPDGFPTKDSERPCSARIEC